MKQIAVYCGAGTGAQPEYVDAARILGRELAKNNIGLVYGGGSVGLMGELAASVIQNNGRVTGVITQHLYEREVAYKDLNDLRVVANMHERKALMAELSDGFIAMPGGLGTLEEIFEAVTWSQLNIHQKPCGFLNILNYYDRLLAFIDHIVDQQFATPGCKDLIMVDDDPKTIIRMLQTYSFKEIDKAGWALKRKPA